MSKQFPSEWLQLHLVDTVEYGKALKAKADEIEDDTWVLELEDIEKHTSVILQRIMFKDRQTKSTKNKFKKGDVLYGKLRPYLNKVVIAEDDGVCSTEILPLSGNTGLNSKYLFYWLKHPTFLEYVTKVGYGVNMPRLGTKDGKQAPFIYAPLAEQKQIATQLDNLLTQVDTLKNRLDAISTHLKRFRQSVLAAAVSGKLYQTGNFKNYKLKDCLEIVSGIAFKKAQYSDNGSRLLQIANVGHGKTIWKKEAFISEKLADKHQSSYLLKDDIVLALNRPITHDTLKVSMINSQDLPATLYQRVARLRTKRKDLLTAKYCYLAMSSNGFKKQIFKNLKGSDQPYINTTKLQQLYISIPSPKEQTEIVTQVEALFAFADKIENRLKQAKEQANNLTPSLLAKAFRGDLTAQWRKQNPDLITGENSAEALLARIKAEQEKLKPKRKTRKKKA